MRKVLSGILSIAFTATQLSYFAQAPIPANMQIHSAIPATKKAENLNKKKPTHSKIQESQYLNTYTLEDSSPVELTYITVDGTPQILQITHEGKEYYKFGVRSSEFGVRSWRKYTDTDARWHNI